MVINKGDTDFLHLMKVHWCLHYASIKSSHVWNVFEIPKIHWAMANQFFHHSSYLKWCLEIGYGHKPMWNWLPTFDEDPWVSSVCQCQVIPCVKHFLSSKIHWAMAKQFFHHSNYYKWYLEIGNGHQPRWCWLPTHHEGQWVSSPYQCQVFTYVKHFLTSKIHWAMAKQFFHHSNY